MPLGLPDTEAVQEGREGVVCLDHRNACFLVVCGMHATRYDRPEIAQRLVGSSGVTPAPTLRRISGAASPSWREIGGRRDSRSGRRPALTTPARMGVRDGASSSATAPLGRDRWRSSRPRQAEAANTRRARRGPGFGTRPRRLGPTNPARENTARDRASSEVPQGLWGGHPRLLDIRAHANGAAISGRRRARQKPRPGAWRRPAKR
jgi:hypothetical protein